MKTNNKALAKVLVDLTKKEPTDILLDGDNKKIDVVDLTIDSALDEGKSKEPSSLGVGGGVLRFGRGGRDSHHPSAGTLEHGYIRSGPLPNVP